MKKINKFIIINIVIIDCNINIIILAKRNLMKKETNLLNRYLPILQPTLSD